MDIRYSCNQRDFKRYTTEEVRNEFLITDLYKADEMVAVYSHVDRMVTLGCMPVNEVVSIDKGIDIWANFGTHYFLERREIGIFNIGDGAGTITADGVAYHLGYKDCLYITQGTKEVTFASDDAAKPAKLWYLKMENTIEFSSEAKREQYRAEVRTLRAMQYFWKVMCYGDFPFTEEVFASIEESMVPRTPKEEILAFIKKELSESINALPKTAVAGRLTRGAAQAFLARVYLITGDYANAANTAQTIMNEGTYSMPNLTYEQ